MVARMIKKAKVNTINALFLQVFLLVPIIISAILITVIMAGNVSAQAQDIDEDKVLDMYDACPDTLKGDALPIIKDDVEFIGCSCRQVAALLSEDEELDANCVDYLCAAESPLELEYRQFSREQVSCSPDYCVNDTLYDYPEQGYPLCDKGRIKQYCAPEILEGKEDECEFLPQGPLEIKMNYTKKPAPWQNITPVNISKPTIPPVIPISEESLEDEVYDKVYQDDWFRDIFDEGLDRETFIEGVNETFKTTIIRTVADRTSEKVAEKVTPVTKYYVSVVPNLYKSYKDVLVFQRIPEEAGFDESSIIFEQEPTYKIKGKLFVWYYENMPSEGISLEYRANVNSRYDPDTLVFSEVSGKPFWLQWWAPWLLVIAIIVGFYHWFKKQVKKHKHSRL